MEKVRNLAVFLSKVGEIGGLAGILSMVGIICADVLGSKLLDLPVPGSTEIVSLIQVATMALVVSATQRDGGHVSVTMLVERLPARFQSAARIVTAVLGLFLFVMLVYEGCRYANQMRLAQEVTGTVKWPISPFVYVFSAAMVPTVLLMLCDLVNSVKEMVTPWNR